MALGSCLWRHTQTITFSFVLSTCSLGLCWWFLPSFSQIDFSCTIYIGDHFTPHHRSTTFMEKAGVRQNYWLERMDYKPRHYDRPTPLFEARKNLFSHCSGSPITLQKEPGEDYRHPALGNFTCPPCSLPTDFLVSRPLRHSSHQL